MWRGCERAERFSSALALCKSWAVSLTVMPPLAGRRLVRPYFFEFVSHVKSRWAGQNIVELFSNEFRQRDRQYYVSTPNRQERGPFAF
jgi:hypothetical protein